MSNTKFLPSTTIIPDRLYVDRAADRQLNAVIEEMGRPGYILVARQMGKTNLLLRMKRERERLGDLALYMDLSTPFETAKDLFRTIIDHLLEVIDDHEVRSKVIHDRALERLDANAEYDRHLRLVLNSTHQDRVIIILDEIDSLVGRDYSDRILSQIRSMYFARANYPVYNKATYVLSGVAEPTDLIKDKNVSPFNIGEKIYLNDFSKEEVKSLIIRSGLDFRKDIIDEIYDWSGGNPRMTWDICSTLEDVQRGGARLTPAEVDRVIHKLYLTRFDRAPLDHIRSLAESDREVRDALIALLYGKGEALDDRARSKLYLAGITTASANEAPRIKNRVIESALSEAWLAQVDAGRRGLLQAAARRYADDEFEQAIELYEQYIAAEGGLDKLSDLNLMDLGLAHFKLSHIAEAKQAFELGLSKTRTNEIRNFLKFHLASAQILSGDANAALSLLEDVASQPGAFRLQALYQMGSSLAALDPVENADRVLQISEEVLDGVQNDRDLSPEQVVELTAASHYNEARIYRATDRQAMAQESLRKAAAPELASELPGLAFFLFDDDLDDQSRLRAFKAATKTVTERRLAYTLSPSTFAFGRIDMAVLLGLAAKFKESADLRNLADVAASNSNTTPFEAIMALVEAAPLSIRSKLDSVVEFALADADLAKDLSSALLLRSRRFLFAVAPGFRSEAAFKTYWSTLTELDESNLITDDDVGLLINRLSQLVSGERYIEAVDLLSFVKERQDRIIGISRVLFAFILFHDMTLAERVNNHEAVREAAREVLNLLDERELTSDPYAEGMRSTVSQLRDRAIAALRGGSVSNNKRIGRNTIVTVREKLTGITGRVKFKKIESRLQSGEFEIIDIDP